MLHLPCQCPSTGQPCKPFENRTWLCSSMLIVYAVPTTGVTGAQLPALQSQHTRQEEGEVVNFVLSGLL